MENLIIYEKVLIKRAIENEIELLEAEVRVKNKDIVLLNGDEDYFDNYIGLTLEIEDIEQKIFDYKEIIKKLELGE